MKKIITCVVTILIFCSCAPEKNTNADFSSMCFDGSYHLSPNGMYLTNIERSPSINFMRHDGALGVGYKLKRLFLWCEGERCTTTTKNSEIKVAKPMVLWVNSHNGEQSDLIIVDSKNPKRSFIIEQGDHRVRSLFDLFDVDRLNFELLMPLEYDSTSQDFLQKKLNLYVKAASLLKSSRDFMQSMNLDDVQNIGPIQFYNDGLAISAFSRNDFRYMVYHSESETWSKIRQYNPSPNHMLVTKTLDGELVAAAQNRLFDISLNKEAMAVYQPDITDSIITNPILDVSTGRLVGLSGLHNISMHNSLSVESTLLNKIISTDILKLPYQTLESVQYSSKGNVFLLFFRNWRNNKQGVKLVKFSNSKVHANTFVCEEENSVETNDLGIQINIETVGEDWKTRILKIEQRDATGSIVFIRGGPVSTIFSEGVYERVYLDYIRKGLNVYIVHYSGMMDARSAVDQRLNNFHEDALIKDAVNLIQFANNIAQKPDQKIMLHSESFGSLMALYMVSESPNVFDNGLFISPWIQHHDPKFWIHPSLVDARQNYEKNLLGIVPGQDSSFLRWQNSLRSKDLKLSRFLVVYGENENRGPLLQMQSYFDKMGARVEVIPDSTHENVQAFDVTKEMVNQHIDDFLRK